ncbi:MAG: hypothetical protein ACKOZL_04555 [Actinomycetes bacterium]
MRAPRFMSAVAVAVLAVSLAACGGRSSGAGRDRDLSDARLIVAGYDDARSARSVRMEGEVAVRTAGRDVAVPLDGAIDFEHDAARFRISLAGLGIPGLGDARVEARVVDGRLYLGLGDVAGALLGGSWAEIPLDSMGGASTDPTGFLDMLRGVTRVERIGTDTIRGVEATHYRGTISLADAIDRAPEARREDLRRAFGVAGAQVPVDVWVDGRDRPVRFAASFAMGGVDAEVRLDLFDYGADITVTAPPADEVTSLGGLLVGRPGDGPAANA